jgi:catechol-2,3-dioxygenase
MSTPSKPATSKPSVGVSVNHLVLNVRDLEASHRFYTEVVGFEQCGEMTHTLTMRFYRGGPDSHHDLALVQLDDPAAAGPVKEWSLMGVNLGVNHIAMAYPDRESWLHQLQHLRNMGVTPAIRGNHGMTHSAYVVDPDGFGIELLYNLPAEVWEGDIDAALNYFEYIPADGDEALQDDTDYQRFGPGTTKKALPEGTMVVERVTS